NIFAACINGDIIIADLNCDVKSKIEEFESVVCLEANNFALNDLWAITTKKGEISVWNTTSNYGAIKNERIITFIPPEFSKEIAERVSALLPKMVIMKTGLCTYFG